MAFFKVTINGRGLWMEVDGVPQRVGFRVARVVDATDQDTAKRHACRAVEQDPKVRQYPGQPPPSLSVTNVTRVALAPAVQPGFAFYPDPERPVG
jgi:hypothetical protein